MYYSLMEPKTVVAHNAQLTGSFTEFPNTTIKQSAGWKELSYEDMESAVEYFELRGWISKDQAGIIRSRIARKL